YHFATTGEKKASKVFLCGGSAQLRPFQRAVEARVGVQVDVLDPRRILRIGPKVPGAQELDKCFMQAIVAVGLALRKERERVHDSN
ncbi:MAG: pilus assembly protein PilM, partial [Sandaracinaceae bacterium]|nr:pilus assembly protein PilM [Sandaracinaceae bacterium]